MKIHLDLSLHCIETELKSLHNRLISKYLKSKKPDEGIEEEIESLQWALEHLDFGMLRSGFPELAGSTDKIVELTAKPGGEIIIYVNGEIVHTR